MQVPTLRIRPRRILSDWQRCSTASVKSVMGYPECQSDGMLWKRAWKLLKGGRAFGICGNDLLSPALSSRPPEEERESSCQALKESVLTVSTRLIFQSPSILFSSIFNSCTIRSFSPAILFFKV